MKGFWHVLWKNHPDFVASAVLVGSAIWLVARSRHRDRATIWAAIGLAGMGLVRSCLVMIAGTDWGHSANFRLPAMLLHCAFVGLLFAAVVVDRRREGGNG